MVTIAPRADAGLSLIELLTTVVIMSILATAAIPLGEVVFIRDKEIELKESLIEMRGAIDRFHAENHRYPSNFAELRWYAPKNKPYLRIAPAQNPMAGGNEAWMLVLTPAYAATNADRASPDEPSQEEMGIYLPAAGDAGFAADFPGVVLNFPEKVLPEPTLTRLKFPFVTSLYEFQTNEALLQERLYRHYQIYDIRFPWTATNVSDPAFYYQSSITNFRALDGSLYQDW